MHTMTERARSIGKLTPRMLAQSRVIAKGNSRWGAINTNTIGMNILALGV